MAFKAHLVTLIFGFLCFGRTLACTDTTKRDVSCKDIKVDNGFKFPVECQGASEISVTALNGTKVQHCFESQNCSKENINITTDSVITSKCFDMQTKCSFEENGKIKGDHCFVFNTTTSGNYSGPGNSSTPWKKILGAVSGVLVFWCAVIALALFFLGKKKRSESSTPTCCFSRLRRPDFARFFSSSEPRTEQSRPADVCAVQMVTSDDCGAQQNPESSDNTTAPNPNGTTAQQTPNGIHRGANNGRSADGHDAEDHENVRQPLLCDNGAAIRSGDGTGGGGGEGGGGGGAAVNKLGFDPKQLNGLSTAPEFDVESKQDVGDEKEEPKL